MHNVLPLLCAGCLLAGSAAARGPAFTAPRYLPDLGLSLPALVGAVADPVPSPRAEAFLVTASDGSRRLVDRYEALDLWTCRTLRARWFDAEGNRLWLARLALSAPAAAAPAVSREEFEDSLDPLPARDVRARDEAVALVAPDVVGAAEEVRRVNAHNLEVFRYACTNDHVLVYAFRPVAHSAAASSAGWYMAALVVAPGGDSAAAEATFREDFLGRITVPARINRAPSKLDSIALPASARLARLDAHRSVVNYDDWHATDGDDVTILDDLDDLSGRAFIDSLTNDLPRLRAAYAAAVPGGLPATNELALVRVFADRAGYLSYVGTNYAWTAAVWAPERRELVLYLPEGGPRELMATVRHEAFHQYLAYSGSMITAAPWLNEGFAELFDSASVDSDGRIVFDEDRRYAAFVHANADALAAALPAILAMDYGDFYGGADADRLAHYAAAWSIAYFLRKGAPEVRGRPFDSLASDYMRALLETRDRSRATAAVFRDSDFLKRFISAWLDFWSRQ